MDGRAGTGARIDADAPVETRLTHWTRFVSARFEASSGTIVVEMTTFDPADTLALGEFLFAESESFINDLADMARRDAVSIAASEFEAAEQRMLQAKLALNAFQEAERTLDPGGQAASAQELLAGLQQSVVEQELLLSQQQRALSDDSVLVQRTERRIADLRAAIAEIEADATSQTADGARPLTALMQDFSALSAEAEFAEVAYLSALGSLETARMEADKRRLYFATIVEPGRPELASFPKPVQGTLIALALAVAAWTIGWISVLAVREHT